MTHQWQPGQRGTINRTKIVTIDRVTPAGTAVVGSEKFNPNGTQRGGSGRLEPMTPEIEDEMDRAARGTIAGSSVHGAVFSAERWVRDVFGTWSRKVPTHDDIKKAERLAAAIKAVLE